MNKSVNHLKHICVAP